MQNVYRLIMLLAILMLFLQGRISSYCLVKQNMKQTESQMRSTKKTFDGLTEDDSDNYFSFDSDEENAQSITILLAKIPLLLNEKGIAFRMKTNHFGRRIMD